MCVPSLLQSRLQALSFITRVGVTRLQGAAGTYTWTVTFFSPLDVASITYTGECPCPQIHTHTRTIYITIYFSFRRPPSLCLHISLFHARVRCWEVLSRSSIFADSLTVSSSTPKISINQLVTGQAYTSCVGPQPITGLTQGCVFLCVVHCVPSVNSRIHLGFFQSAV